MRRAAVVDIGTNSVLYLLAERAADGRVVGCWQKAESPRLGENLDVTGRIAEKPLERTIAVLKQFRGMAESHRPDRLVAVGTHLFRKADNRKEVIRRLMQETGIAVEVLTEREEAERSYCGAVYGRILDEPVVVVDIGGGSTEAALGVNGQLREAESLPLGAVSLTERTIQHDPLSPEETARLDASADAAVAERLAPLLRLGKQLVAVGGTATTLAALNLGMTRYDPAVVDGTVLGEEDVLRYFHTLTAAPINARKAMLAFDPDRADIIAAGTALLKAVMRAGSFHRVLVSDSGLRFGIALREFQTEKNSENLSERESP